MTIELILSESTAQMLLDALGVRGQPWTAEVPNPDFDANLPVSDDNLLNVPNPITKVQYIKAWYRALTERKIARHESERIHKQLAGAVVKGLSIT